MSYHQALNVFKLVPPLLEGWGGCHLRPHQQMPLNPMYSTVKEGPQNRYGFSKQMVLTKLHLRKRGGKKKAASASPCQYWLSLLACVHCQGQHAVFTHRNTLHTHILGIQVNGERFLSLFHYQSSKSRRKSRGDTEGEEEQETKNG